MELEFFGAAGEVTGSCHILKVGRHKVLLDCGMIQGGKKQEARNRDPFPFNPAKIDAVVLSHAHIDHSGRLPLLVQRGFSGPIFTHNATKELCKILLADSANLQERDVEYKNRKRERKGLKLLEPLYTSADAKKAVKQLRGRRYDKNIQIVPGISARFHDAGHIMGSAVVELNITEGSTKRRLVFSGDLGQHDAPILRDPCPVERADLVLMESTYGGRVHRERERTVEEIGTVISEAHAGKGNILIPAFAVGRSQDVLYMFGNHYAPWKLKRWRVFLDSPLAIEASKIYWEYPHLYDGEATTLRRRINEMPKLKNLHFTTSADESRVINKMKNGAIVIAGSGMCNGGRILHHLKHNAWRRECHIIIVGYQARGSIGRQLVDGRKKIRIYGETIAARAKVHTVGGLSAHGDQEDLTRWYSGFSNRPPVFLVHGEPESGKALKTHMARTTKTKVKLATPGMKIDLRALRNG